MLVVLVVLFSSLNRGGMGKMLNIAMCVNYNYPLHKNCERGKKSKYERQTYVNFGYLKKEGVVNYNNFIERG